MASLIENGPDHHVIRSAGIDLITPRGDPVPPQDIVARLKALNPRYSLEWVSGAWGTSYYGLFEAWAENDRRWQTVQSGETPKHKARDLLYMFPPECSPREFAAYVEQRFGPAVRDPRAEADRLVAQAQKLYAEALDTSVDKTIAMSMERRERESDHDLQVRGGLATPTPMATVGIDLKEPKRLIPKE